MAPVRRLRLGIFLGVLALLTVIYITTGASSTRSSQFYTRTISRIDTKARLDAKVADALKQKEPVVERLRPPIDLLDEDNQKDALKQAGSAAKKNADERWREAHGDTDAPVQRVAPQPIERSREKHQEEESGGLAAAEAELAHILTLSPTTIFSKTFCPYSRKAKHILLDAYSIRPSPHVVELDKHRYGSELQDVLLARTGRRTVPNILIKGKSIGGGDDIENLWRTNKLKETIQDIGGSSIKNIVQNLHYGDDLH